MNTKGGYLDQKLPIEERVEDLLSEMSIDEKVAQLTAKLIASPFLEMLSEYSGELSTKQRAKLFSLFQDFSNEEKGLMSALSTLFVKKHWSDSIIKVDNGKGYSIGHISCILRSLSPRESAELSNEIQRFAFQSSRLRIPILIHDECLHGCMAKGSTIFPQSIAMAASWDPSLMEKVASAIGKETRARGIHQCLSPTVNIARDPRCGRVEETYGEDPYLSSIMSFSFTNGLQAEGVVATPKHFVANFAGDGGRDSYPIHFSERFLREIYLPSFQAAVEKAGALSLMSAYNSYDGVPCSANRWLLCDLLRREWGFRGYVVSDYSAVEHIHTKHRAATDRAESAQKALEAGLDVELPESDCFEKLTKLVELDEVSKESVDKATRRVLRVKFLIGLFDDPFVDPDYAEEIADCEDHRKLASRAAQESIVLLKNNHILPLSEDIESISVIGPNAAVPRLGGYSGFGVKVITPLEGVKNRASEDTNVYFIQGCNLTSSLRGQIDKAKKATKQSDVALVFLGNSVPETEGEQKDRTNLNLPGVQEELIKAVSGTGTPVVVILINGSAITMEGWIEEAEAILEAWYPGEEGGNAIADVLFGDCNPGGKLPISFPRTTGQLPLYYNHKPTGRVDDYVDKRGKQALFPFGHGLSYTEFRYDSLSINPSSVKVGDPINISIDLENTGKYSGDEVVQLYICRTVSEIVRPLKQLKGFKRVNLKPGEKKTVVFTLFESQLTHYDEDMDLVLEPGEFTAMVGSSSEDIRQIGKFKVIGEQKQIYHDKLRFSDVKVV